MYSTLGQAYWPWMTPHTIGSVAHVQYGASWKNILGFLESPENLFWVREWAPWVHYYIQRSSKSDFLTLASYNPHVLRRHGVVPHTMVRVLYSLLRDLEFSSQPPNDIRCILGWKKVLLTRAILVHVTMFQWRKLQNRTWFLSTHIIFAWVLLSIW